jgi:hypothetical protein
MTSPLLNDVPLNELLEAILPLKSEQCRPIPKVIAHILSNALKDRLDYKVQFNSFDGEELAKPYLWLYSDWYNCSQRYYADKERSERERVERWIKNANIENLTKALMKSQGFDKKYAQETAINLLRKGATIEVLEVFGLKKLITSEKEL